MTFNSIAHQLGISQSTSNKNGNAQDLRILQTAGNEHVAIPASSKNWNSSLTLEERNQYELMINLKSSFAVSLEFLPKTFEPESAQYLIDVGKISFGFGIIAGFVLLLVFFYLMLRFCCKKCIGPVKTSQVSKKYKKITWVLLSK